MSRFFEVSQRKTIFNSQAPDVLELAHQGIFQLSRLSVNCYVKTMKKYPLRLNRKNFKKILSVPQDHCGSHNNFMKVFLIQVWRYDKDVHFFRVMYFCVIINKGYLFLKLFAIWWSLISLKIFKIFSRVRPWKADECVLVTVSKAFTRTIYIFRATAAILCPFSSERLSRDN